MRWWLLREHKAFKPSVVALILVLLGSVAYWFTNKPKQWSAEELSRYISVKPSGQFKPYSAKEMKNLKLISADFIVPIEMIRSRAADPRVEAGLMDHYSLATLYSSGDLVEWDAQIRVEAADKLKQEATYVQKGNVRIADKEWIDFHQVQLCQPKSSLLSSGVVTHSLDCQLTSTTKPLEKLNVKEESCSVVATSYRGRKIQSQFGKYTIKRIGTFPKSVMETTTIDGDLICDGRKRGSGQEKSIVIYSAMEPSLLNPGAGTRKILFSLKTVYDSLGGIVSQVRVDLLRTIRPEPLYPEKKRISKNNVKPKYKKKKFARNNL